MPDPIIVLTVVSGIAMAFGLAKSAWHGCKLERLLHLHRDEDG